LIEPSAFGADRFEHGVLPRGEIVGILAREVAGGVLASAPFEAEAFVQSGHAQTLRRFGRGANVRRPGLSAIHAAAPGVL
jgi:hypothetical protein